MLNFRLLYVLINPRSIRTYLGLCASLGFGVLLDIIIFLRLSLMVGPWITMAVITANSALGLFFIYSFIDLKSRQMVESIDRGEFDPNLFSRYLSTLISSFFLIIPGLLNTVAGVIILIPYVGEKLGARFAALSGISWQEAYEFLRLDRMTGSRIDINADS